MRTKLVRFATVSAFLFISLNAQAEKVCGLVTDDQPEIAANLDELRRFTITDKQGGTHSVVTEIDPDFIRGAPLRAIREAKQNRMEICVTGTEVLGSDAKHLLVLTVDRNNQKSELEEPIARAPAATKSIKK